MKNTCAQFTVIDGGKFKLEQKKRVLFATPELLEQQEFENLCDALGLRLADIAPLIERRVRLNAKDTLERNLVLSILDGDDDEYNRLSNLIGRRNKLSVVTYHG